MQSESAEAHANLASAYKDAARHDNAIQSYQKALKYRPDFPEAFANYVHSLCCVCEWKDRASHFQRLEQEVGGGPSVVGIRIREVKKMEQKNGNCHKNTVQYVEDTI